ncbi:MAG: hypothetical protein J6Y17_01490 [Elusimicrobiaceae bacterium]|nr:hypothetical protein [Elusimicrobiaceae bacterium]
MRTLSEDSISVTFGMFFAFFKAILAGFVVLVIVLIAGQSRVAPVSVNLLTTYAMEYAVSTFKPYRHLFPEPYVIDLNTK